MNAKYIVDADLVRAITQFDNRVEKGTGGPARSDGCGASPHPFFIPIKFNSSRTLRFSPAIRQEQTAPGGLPPKNALFHCPGFERLTEMARLFGRGRVD